MKVAENSPQNARNCTIFKNFLGGACPQTPLAKARSFAARDMPLRGMYIQNPGNFKVGPPPPEKSCIRPCVHSIHLSSSAYFQSHFKRINGIEIYVESWNRGASSFLVPNLIRNFRKHFGSGVLKFGPAP